MAGTLWGRQSKPEKMTCTGVSFPFFCSLNTSSFDMKVDPVREFPSWHIQQKLQKKPCLSGQRPRKEVCEPERLQGEIPVCSITLILDRYRWYRHRHRHRYRHGYIFLLFLFQPYLRETPVLVLWKGRMGNKNSKKFLWAKQVFWGILEKMELEKWKPWLCIWTGISSGLRLKVLDRLKEVNKIFETLIAIGITTHRRRDRICSLILTGLIACFKSIYSRGF